jgi:hypothetical protein
MPQTQDSGIQTDISKTLRNMEIQTDEQILQIPQIPQPSLQIPKEFTAPTQDIQPSAVQNIVNLTQENLQQLGGISKNKEYAPSEISSMTEGTSMSINTDISKLIQQEAKKRQERQQTLDEIMEKQKEKKKEEKKSEGMYGQIYKEIEKRRNLLQPPEEETDDSEWDIKEIKDVIIENPVEKPVEKSDKKMTRKPGSGRPKGSGNKTQEEKNYDDILKEGESLIRGYSSRIKKMKKQNLNVDEDGYSIYDYEKMIRDSESTIYEVIKNINEMRSVRNAPLLPDYDPIFEDDEEEDEDEY